ncbi:hypothetical protein VM1G_07939 [Cytospora mali]|uniref:Hypervirulence associated protein TUDOR domain-containing protein n=1 Tax=Cytospora mali TaxID=578113 RepID=A0A194W7P6_CYTMA|nr:hypothetical protein VM1G_07939 [Valsa mali]
MPAVIKDKDGQPIKEGDKVWTKARGGKHEGIVDRVVTTEAEAEEIGVKNPPKVLFEDQHGHNVTHNPGTLQHRVLVGSRDEREQWIGKTRGFELHYGDETFRALNISATSNHILNV